MNSVIKIFYIYLIINFISIIYADENSNKSGNDILIGMSTVLTGPSEFLGKNFLTGVLSFFEAINKAGGIRGRKIKVIAYDDGYEPKQTTVNMNKLVDEDNVLLIHGNVGTPTAIATLPIVNNKKILLFAPFTGAEILRKCPPDRYVINFRASYKDEISSMINALINLVDLTNREIAFFTQNDAYGDAGFYVGIDALKKYRKVNEYNITHVRYERNTIAVEQAASELIIQPIKPKAIIMVGSYLPCAKFIKILEANDLKPIFLNLSFVGTQPLANLIKDSMQKVIVTQVVPHFKSVNIPIVKKYLSDLKEFDMNCLPSFISLEGYISAKILSIAIMNIKGDINRESIIDSLHKLNTFDVGLNYNLFLSEQHHQASNKIWPTIIRNGIISDFNWNSLKNNSYE